MRRRELIFGIGGAALAWPLAAQAQQAKKVPVIGYMSGGSASFYAAGILPAFRDVEAWN